MTRVRLFRVASQRRTAAAIEPPGCTLPPMSQSLTRRGWLELVSAVSVGTTFTDGNAQQPGPTGQRSRTPAAHDLGARVYNIRDHGAKGDGATIDTKAVQAAIDACHGDGGGTVLVPAGTFAVGTIEIKSHVTLHLTAGATLLGSADGTQYHAVDAIPLTGDSTLGDGNWALLFAVDAHDIAIEGPGRIDGQGL